MPVQDFTIHPSGNFTWKVVLTEYDPSLGHLLLKVVDYYPVDCEGFSSQRLRNAVKSIAFEQLDWYYFGGFLSSYRKSGLQEYIIDHPDVYIPDQRYKEFHYEIRTTFKDLHFGLGVVTFWAELPALPEPLEISIANSHILPEFDFIKSYFANALGKKNLKVKIDLLLKGNQIAQIKAQSKEIEGIDEQMISTLKNTRILGLQKAPKVIAVDKYLFNADEVFDHYYDEPDPNLFRQNALDILKDLAAQGVVRNRKQLEYLAGRKQLSDQKILITLAPDFGFLFVSTSGARNHFIWELINSHATYVWSFLNSTHSMEQQIKKVEEIIGIVREQGRERYRNYYQTDLVNLPYDFNLVIHRHADRSILDPFPGWKHRLEEILVNQ